MIETGNEILNTMLFTDLSTLSPIFEKVISGQSDFEESTGNVCRVEISKNSTKIYDVLSEDEKYSEISTEVIGKLIKEYEVLLSSFMEANNKGKLDRMICPFCEQGYILKAKVKKTNKTIFVCDECESVWVDKIDESHVTNLEDYFEKENIPSSWDELEVISKIKEEEKMFLGDVYLKKITLVNDSMEEFKEKLGSALDILNNATEDSYEEMTTDGFMDWVCDLSWIPEDIINIEIDGPISPSVKEVMDEICNFWQNDAETVIKDGKKKIITFTIQNN